MSLAELFFAKHPRRPARSRYRFPRNKVRSTQGSEHRIQQFQLEALEPRLLLSATPTELVAPESTGAPEPAGTVVMGGLTEVIATDNQAAPGGGNFLRTLSPVINEAGQVAFWGNQSDPTNNTGIYLGDGATLSLIAREGQAAPGGGTYTGFNDVLALNEAGQVVFFGFQNDPINNSGLYRSNGITNTLIAREGQAAPGGGNFTDFAFIPTAAAFGLNESGQVAFYAAQSDPVNNTGLYLYNGSTVTLVAREGQTIEGTLKFSLFEAPVINDAGQVAFAASNYISFFNGLLRVVYGNGGGDEVELNRAGQVAGTQIFSPAEVFRIDGTTKMVIAWFPDPMPGGGLLSDLPGHTALNDSGQVAFVAKLFETTASSEGIFRGSTKTDLIALARAGEQVPDGNGTFATFGAPTITDGGAVLFMATLAGTTGGVTDDTGLFLTDGIEIIQVAREGQALAGSTITQLKIVEEDRGGTRAVNDSGQVAYYAALANSNEAVVRFSVPSLQYRSTTDGSWDTGANWTLSLRPWQQSQLAITPLLGLTVAGPAAATTIQDLTLGAQAGGVATLRLNGGGNLSVTNDVTIQGLGAFDQQLGTVTAATLTNAGTLTQAGGTALNVGALTNTGQWTVRGQVTGTNAAQALLNQGTLTLLDGSLSGAGGVTNDFGASMSGEGTVSGAFLNNGTLTATGLLTALGATTNVGQIFLPLTGIFSPTGGLSNTGLIELSGGAVTGTGTVTNQAGGIIEGEGAIAAPLLNLGVIQVADGKQVLVSPAFTSSGLIRLFGSFAQLTGGVLTNTGLVSGQGILSNRVTNTGVIRAEGGTLTLASTSNTNSASGRIETGTGTSVLYTRGLATNAGMIALMGGRFDNSTVALTNTGRIEGRGVLATGGLTNATGGLVSFADGLTDILGAITNNATLNVTASTSTFFNPVTNSSTGTIKNTAGVTRFLAGLTNNGAYISDPADNHFTDLTISDTGYLVGGQGDRFIVSDDLLNTSTQATNWQTEAAELIFQNGVDAHDFAIAGADHAGAVGGFANNFAWGTVRLAAGQTLRLQDGNATQGGALYVKHLLLEGGLAQINSITGNGLNIYYDSLAPANSYLGEQTYQLQNGGVLAPMRSLDFDANGRADALTDGILAVRHLFGFTGNALTAGAVDPAGLRITSSAIGNYLGQAQGSLLDVDGNGRADALTDGILMIRYLFGFSGDALITGAVDPAGTRTTAAAIEAFLAGFLPGATTAAAVPVAPGSPTTAAVVMDTPTSTTAATVAPTDLSLAYVQQSWVQKYVAADASVTGEDEELLIALPG